MNRKFSLIPFYYLIAMVSFIATWYHNGQYILQGGGLGPHEFFGAAFANKLTTAVTIDVYLAGLAFAVWVVSESRRIAVKWPWLYVAVCFGIGLAISLPLYFASREKARVEKRTHA